VLSLRILFRWLSVLLQCHTVAVAVVLLSYAAGYTPGKTVCFYQNAIDFAAEPVLFAGSDWHENYARGEQVR
jgi:hypothetical protein